DSGRYTVTNAEADMYLLKVPMLRNISITAPYFHNGSVATLDEAVRVMARIQLNQDLSDGQVADIVAFLDALTGEFPQQPLPQLPPTPGRSIIK
ncbi:MAG: cytochrome-c peroxidase, partial [Gammaproteobacteria bacterium]